MSGNLYVYHSPYRPKTTSSQPDQDASPSELLLREGALGFAELRRRYDEGCQGSLMMGFTPIVDWMLPLQVSSHMFAICLLVYSGVLCFGQRGTGERPLWMNPPSLPRFAVLGVSFSLFAHLNTKG